MPKIAQDLTWESILRLTIELPYYLLTLFVYLFISQFFGMAAIRSAREPLSARQ